MEVIDINDSGTYVIDTHAKDITLNINKCRAIITDISSSCKNINVVNGELEYSYIKNKGFSCNNNINVNGGKCVINVIDLDKDNSINNYLVDVNDEYSEFEINIASIAKGDVNKDYKIYSKNNVMDTKVKIDCFGIVEGKSSLKYDITSFIKHGAKRSVVNQNSKILLFDKESVGVNNPILEIEENDVKANHGSSIGMIDEETLFYLTSRGIKESVARELVSMGKITYLIEKIKDEKIKQELLERV